MQIRMDAQVKETYRTPWLDLLKINRIKVYLNHC